MTSQNGNATPSAITLADNARRSMQAQGTQARAAAALNTRKGINDLLIAQKDQIAAALPKHLTPERLIRVALTSISRNPKLLECSTPTLIGAIIQASQLGLEPDGVLGQAYLVPFRNNRTNATECQFIPGYRGYIDLARRSDRIKSIMAQVVREGDLFSYEYGINETLKHVPGDRRGEITHVYGYAKFTNGGYAFVVLTLEDINRTRLRSKSKDSGPWVTDFEAMAQKTAIRRLAKWLPLSVEFARAVELDERAAAGLAQGLNLEAIDKDTGEIIVPESAAEVVEGTDPTSDQPADFVVEMERAAAKAITDRIAAARSAEDVQSITLEIDRLASEGILTADTAKALGSDLLSLRKGSRK
jgi:recombination protein RecT